ncbi:MAG: hypothetical protein ACYSTL_08000, partial [Planctomycetota bacterium]
MKLIGHGELLPLQMSLSAVATCASIFTQALQLQMSRKLAVSELVLKYCRKGKIMTRVSRLIGIGVIVITVVLGIAMGGDLRQFLNIPSFGFI